MWDTSMRVELSSVVMVSSLSLLALIHSEVSPKEVIFKNVRKFVVTGGTTQDKRHFIKDRMIKEKWTNLVEIN